MSYIIDNDGIGIIPNNTEAINFRQSVENKNLLAEKGSIYIGTGQYIDLGEGKKIAKTTALAAGGLNTVLQVGEGATLQYGKLTTDNIDQNNFISPKADKIRVQDNYCSVVQKTQKQYDDLTKSQQIDANTLYIIIG